MANSQHLAYLVNNQISISEQFENLTLPENWTQEQADLTASMINVSQRLTNILADRLGAGD